MGCCGPSFGRSNKKEKETNTSQTENPLDLLKIRLAKGEITFEEYEKTKAVLTQ